MPVYWGSKRISSVSAGGVQQAPTGPAIPTELCPQIVCADNHLRDIVIEEDGKPYIRIGFFNATSDSDRIRFSVATDIIIHHFRAIGRGGNGTAATSGAIGRGGYAGQEIGGSLLQLKAGTTYEVYCGYNTTTMLKHGVQTIIKANNGANGAAIVGVDSSASGLPGSDGYMLDIQPTGLEYNVSFPTAKTGAGLGAGGAGGSVGSYGADNTGIHGLGGGVFLYVEL